MSEPEFDFAKGMEMRVDRSDESNAKAAAWLADLPSEVVADHFDRLMEDERYSPAQIRAAMLLLVGYMFQGAYPDLTERAVAIVTDFGLLSTQYGETVEDVEESVKLARMFNTGDVRNIE